MTHRPRALVVAYSFPPHAAIGTQRTLRVVRQMHDRGWDVAVLTGTPDTFLPSTPIEDALLERVPAGVRIVRAPSLRPWLHLQDALLGRFRSAAAPSPAADAVSSGAAGADSKSRSRRLAPLIRAKDIVDAALAIPDRESGWIVPAVSTAVVDRLRGFVPDVIYSSAPPWTGQIVAASVRHALRKPWVADFRDPWARAPWRGERYAFTVRASQTLERFVVRRADRVVFVTTANRDEFASYYGPTVAAKFAVVPNGCDPGEFDALRDVSVPANGPFVVLHAGSLYAGRTPMPLLHALVKAIDRGAIDPSTFRLRFLGTTALQGVDLAATSQRLGLGSVVEFLPRVPREQSLRAVMSASALLLLQPGHAVSVPGKVYEYLAAGRPILAVAPTDGEIASLVKQSAGGIVVSPDREEEMVEALATLVGRGTTPNQAPARELFDGNLGASNIVDILQRVIDERRHGHALAPTEVPGR